MAGVVVAILGLFLLFGPIELLARKPSPVRRDSRPKLTADEVPTWMKVFFRGLGIALLVLAGLLLAPALGVSPPHPSPRSREAVDAAPELRLASPEHLRQALRSS